MDKKLIAVAAVSAVVGAAAALGVVAVLSKVKSGKYCVCIPGTCGDDCCKTEEEKAESAFEDFEAPAEPEKQDEE